MRETRKYGSQSALSNFCIILWCFFPWKRVCDIICFSPIRLSSCCQIESIRRGKKEKKKKKKRWSSPSSSLSAKGEPWKALSVLRRSHHPMIICGCLFAAATISSPESPVSSLVRDGYELRCSQMFRDGSPIPAISHSPSINRTAYLCLFYCHEVYSVFIITGSKWYPIISSDYIEITELAGPTPLPSLNLSSLT